MNVGKEVYRRGDFAEVSLAVSRQTTAEPIRGARVALLLQFKGEKSLHGVGRTDRQGRSRISINLRRSDVSVGKVRMYGYAYLGMLEPGCLRRGSVRESPDLGAHGLQTAYRVAIYNGIDAREPVLRRERGGN